VRVLIVDDHPELLDLVARALTRDGHVVQGAGSCREARACLRERAPDVLILDLALPDGSGSTLCAELRSEGASFPILMLTAHGEVAQRVAGLDAGADDFLAKPFAMAELRARVRALARRGQQERVQCVELAGTVLDFARRRAERAGEEIPFTAREWAILELLAAQLGQAVDRNTILESVWGEDTESTSGSLDVLMARVRRKLGANSVRTLRGKGYALDGARSGAKP
jgi:two-component system, OmpR family, response regulator